VRYSVTNSEGTLTKLDMLCAWRAQACPVAEQRALMPTPPPYEDPPPPIPIPRPDQPPDVIDDPPSRANPVSEAKFPASREFTGNFIESELSGASMRAKKAINSVSYEPIPYASEQGIF
jgi:hypothetical protein